MQRREVVMVAAVLGAGVSLADAEPSAGDALVEQHARVARDAAKTGNCDVVQDALEAVRAIDVRRREVLEADQVIAMCVGARATGVQTLRLRAAHQAAVDGDCARARGLARRMLDDGISVGHVSSPALAGCLWEPVPPTPRPSPGARRPLSMRLLLGGGAVGSLIAIPVSFTAVAASGGDNGGVFVAYATTVLAYSLSTYVVGTKDNHAASFPATFLGALGGAAIAWAVMSRLDDEAEESAAPIIFLAPCVGAMLGYSVTHTYAPPVMAGSVVARRRGGWSLGVPTLMRGERATTLSIVSGAF